ncbi:MAG: Ig-like protein [Geminicoccaceae bacterium]|nr:Ig-like protein [Geminicoccaceae bacterium]
MTRSVESARRVARTAAVAAVSTVPALLGAQNGEVARLHAASNGSYVSSTPRASTASAGAPASISIEGGARRVLVGATVPHTARVRDAAGAERRDVAVKWTSSNPNIASVNQFGVLTAARPGSITVRAVAGGLAAERKYMVEVNPVKSLTLSITADQARTGDVVEVSATAFDANGLRVANVPFLYTFTAAVEDSAVGQMAPAALDQKGRFVAQNAGDYQIIAVAPGLVAHRTVRVSNREVGESARLVAKAALGAPTTDVYAWRGRDGRQYALACTGGSRGQLVSFEVGDATLKAIDTASVDGKSVTDCVVEEGGLGVAVREVANGRSSLALFDASDPRALKRLATFDEGIGAASGVALYKRHVYVVSDARRLDVVSVEDPARPRRVGSVDLGAAGGNASDAATDVSVSDGVAYVALGRNGVALVDVGSGKFGGSPAKPVRVGAFRAPFASTHAAYGYRSRTGKWYVVTSEDLGSVDAARGAPSGGLAQPGFARIIDFSDPAHPEEVARYEVPEAGVQDLWVENERLYVAAQTGGLRVVDISADLKGNLYHQGREVARLGAVDGSALPNVIAVHPIGGTVLVADRNSGVWMVQLVPRP